VLAKEFIIPDGYKFHGQTVDFPALVLLDESAEEAVPTWARASAIVCPTKNSPRSSRKWSGAPPPEQVQQNHDDGDYQKDVNEPTHRESAH